LTGSVAASVSEASSWPHRGTGRNIICPSTTHGLNIVDVPGPAVTENRMALLIGGPTVFTPIPAGIRDEPAARTPNRDSH
jgi:hypothetical protein